jgi:glycosyltransferase involved in cell wall biosynthesis
VTPHIRLTVFIAGHFTASSRLRVLQYIPMLENDQVRVRVCSTRPSTYLPRPAYLKHGSILHRTYQVLGMALVVGQLLWQIAVMVPRSDVVLLQKRLLFRSRTGVLEFLLLRVARRHNVRVVFDVDDAIHLGTSAGPHRGLHRPVMSIASRANLVIAGSPRLAEDFAPYAAVVQVAPTCLASLRAPCGPQPESNGVTRVLWTGSPGNAVHLQVVGDALAELAPTVPLRFEVVSRLADLPAIHIDGVEIHLTEYSPKTERAALRRSDLGVAPLIPSPWTEAKCGGRVLAYFSAGLPVIASPVGAQATIVRHRLSGLHATTREEWAMALRLLIGHRALRRRLGDAGLLQIRREHEPEASYNRWRDWVLGR